ncbi:hypothetical protein HGM15179_018322 [Zosterops borbonicus]|uniref:Uncharacterized protein n=1 Tax=Zosterops borbonicus TaxID=364589 RepID=A0A8K1FZA3_9PASS|nr:hypothetical protein HGM15179_018322 [Zosterops borbonicus]
MDPAPGEAQLGENGKIQNIPCFPALFPCVAPVGLLGNLGNGSRWKGDDPKDLMDLVGFEEDPRKVMDPIGLEEDPKELMDPIGLEENSKELMDPVGI